MYVYIYIYIYIYMHIYIHTYHAEVNTLLHTAHTYTPKHKMETVSCMLSFVCYPIREG